MENFTNILSALQAILPTQLLAPSRSALAAKLGTPRTTLYRIMDGKFKEGAMQNLLSQLDEQLNVNVTSLLRMEAAINNERDFTKLIKPECDLQDPEWPYKVIFDFVSHDYSSFSPDFRNGVLNQILPWERRDPMTFFNMLAYFYINRTDVKFYTPGKTHKERCAAVMEELGMRLIERFPSNGLAAGIVFAYSKTDFYNMESQTLWSLVQNISTMLKTFASPLDATESECNFRLLQGLSVRSYWKGKDPDKVFLLWLQPGRKPATGHYELFSIDRHSGAPKGIASLFLLTEEILSIFIKETYNALMGLYQKDGDRLSFQWEKEGDDPMETGNSLTLLSPANSQSLRELDRSLSDDALTREMARSEGFDYDFAMQPADVILSRQELTIVLKDGSRHSIAIATAPFLSTVTPGETIMVVRHLADDDVYVVWPQLRQSLPFNLFKKI